MKGYRVIEEGQNNMGLIFYKKGNKNIFSVTKLNSALKGKEFSNFMECNMYFNKFRYKDVLINEFCSTCGSDEPIKNDFKIQRCGDCGELIYPCQICEQDFVSCGSACPLNMIKKYTINLNNDSFEVLEDEVKKYMNTNINKFLSSYTKEDAEYLANKLGIRI